MYKDATDQPGAGIIDEWSKSSIPLRERFDELFKVSDDEYGLSWILLVEAPHDYVPAIFPTELVRRSGGILTMLALNSKFWSLPRSTEEMLPGQLSLHAMPLMAACGPRYISPQKWVPKYQTTYDEKLAELPDEVSTQEVAAILGLVEDDTSPSTKTDEDLPEFSANVLRLFQKSRSDKVVVIPAIVRQCVAILQGYNGFMTSFNGKPPTMKHYFRTLLVLQIRELDNWLANIYQDEAHVHVLMGRLLSTTLSLLDTEALVRNQKGASGLETSTSVPITGTLTSGQDSGAQKQTEAFRASSTNDDPIGKEAQEMEWRSLDLSRVEKTAPLIRHLPVIVELDSPDGLNSLADETVVGQELRRMFNQLHKACRDTYGFNDTQSLVMHTLALKKGVMTKHKAKKRRTTRELAF